VKFFIPPLLPRREPNQYAVEPAVRHSMPTTLVRILASRVRRLTDLIPRRLRLEFLVGIRLTVDRES
jgi:hypothetical protein